MVTLSHYAVEIDLDNANTSHTQVVDLVGENARVLDVGCWTGDVGRVLKKRGCTVTGVEIDEEAARIAREHLDAVVVCDLERTPLDTQFERGSFDVVIFADVLEHLMDPRSVLASATALLAPGGRVVISVPNVTHGSLRLALLQGRWNYTETGLLDRTHIRFFTRQGLAELVAAAGFVVEDLRGTIADPLDVEVSVDDTVFPEPVVEWVRNQPDALVYQFVLAVRPAQEGDQAHPVPPLRPAANPQDVRRHDAHTDLSVDQRRAELVRRDQMIALQAAAAQAKWEVSEVRKEIRGVWDAVTRRDRRIERQRDRIERLRGQVARLRVQVKGLEGELAGARSQQYVRRALRKVGVRR